MCRPLAAHLCVTIHGRDLVLLDVRSGDYELLAGLGEHVRLSPDRRSLSVEDPELTSALESLQIFDEALSRVGRPIRALPTQTPLPGCGAAISIPDRCSIAVTWLAMFNRYHQRSFSGLITDALSRRPGHPLPRQDHLRKAEIFDRLSVWLPFQRDCLYRCCALLHGLGNRGYAVDWVFGVRTWPFAAHCWLQLDDQVLTDYPDRLAMFSPILAV